MQNQHPRFALVQVQTGMDPDSCNIQSLGVLGKIFFFVSCDPGYFRAAGSWVFSRGCGNGCKTSAQDLLRALVQTGKDMCPWLCRISCFPGARETQLLQVLDQMLLPPLLWCWAWQMSHLGAELPLAVMGLSEEPLPKVYTGPWFRPEGTCTPDLARVPVSLKPGGPNHFGCWGRCCGLSCDPGCFRAPGSWAFSRCCGNACTVSTQGLLRGLVQTRRASISFIL